jgi:hypothetical protein
MVETVDGLPGDVGSGGAKVSAGRIPGRVKSQAHDVNSSFMSLIQPVYLFTVAVEVTVHFAQPFDILGSCSHVHSPFVFFFLV